MKRTGLLLCCVVGLLLAAGVFAQEYPVPEVQVSPDSAKIGDMLEISFIYEGDVRRAHFYSVVDEPRINFSTSDSVYYFVKVLLTEGVINSSYSGFDPEYDDPQQIRIGEVIINSPEWDPRFIADVYIVVFSCTGVDNFVKVPAEYSLGQNYPNPFNPITSIDFVIEKSGNVKVTVFNMLGEQVATLTNRHYQVGRYILTWKAANMPSGVYSYRLEAGEFTMTKKMMLVR